MDLDGKVAVVTGAGRGIGYSIAERLAGEGAAVCVNYLGYEDEAKALAQRLPKGIAVKADVSKAAEVQAMVDATVKTFGTIDVLINNAGLERSVPFLDIDEATWDLMLDVDLKGAFFCARACGRVMRDSGRGGSIVNISSIHEDVPFPGFTPYCAAKGGLRLMMRMGRPEEVAEVALFLASDSSSYVTGSTYYVDGGMVRYSQPL